MKNKNVVCTVLLGTASIFFSTFSHADAEPLVVVPLFSVSGEAVSSQVMKGQTFSSTKGKDLTGSLEVSPSMQTYATPKYGMRFNFLPVGIFTMGSPDTEPGGPYSDETQHEVTLTASFYIQSTEVTQQQWKAVVQDAQASGYLSGELLEEPSLSAGGQYKPELPVENVSWNDVNLWIQALNQLTGRLYRLPTEAQWEYAARASTTTAWAYSYSYDHSAAGETVDDTYNPNLDAMGWYVWQTSTGSTVGYGEESKPIARKQPNRWGVHDMHGNVAEWCMDWYGTYGSEAVCDPQGPVSGTTRVVRGGSYDGNAGGARSAARASFVPDTTSPALGFRLTLYPGSE